MTQPSAAIVDVGTNIKGLNDPNMLSPRATRWGFRPIWEIVDLPGDGFLAWSLPPNRFRAFRLFQFQAPDGTGKLVLVDRNPSEQVMDLAQYPFFIDFPEVAMLQNDVEAKQIFTILTNPNTCTMYPFDRKTDCATCWLDYLRKLKPESGDGLSPEGLAALAASREKMAINFQNALEEANRQIDEAVSQINDVTAGKNTYQPVDYLNIQHTHNAMPEYKTSNPQAATAKVLGQELGKILSNQQQPAAIPQEFIDEFNRMKDRLEVLESARSFDGTDSTLVAELPTEELEQKYQAETVAAYQDSQIADGKYPDGTDLHPDDAADVKKAKKAK